MTMKLTTVLLVVSLGGLSVFYGAQGQENPPVSSTLNEKANLIKNFWRPMETLPKVTFSIDLNENQLEGMKIVCPKSRSEQGGRRAGQGDPTSYGVPRTVEQTVVAVKSGSMKISLGSFSGGLTVISTGENGAIVKGFFLRMELKVGAFGQLGCKDKVGGKNAQGGVKLRPQSAQSRWPWAQDEYGMGPKRQTVYAEKVNHIPIEMEIIMTEKNGKVTVATQLTNGIAPGKSSNRAADELVSKLIRLQLVGCKFDSGDITTKKLDNLLGDAQESVVDSFTNFLQAFLDGPAGGESITKAPPPAPAPAQPQIGSDLGW